MTINTRYSTGAKLYVKVDGGDAEGVITALTYRLNPNGDEAINYELDASWTYQGKKNERHIICTEVELMALQAERSRVRTPDVSIASP